VKPRTFVPTRGRAFLRRFAKTGPATQLLTSLMSSLNGAFSSWQKATSFAVLVPDEA
jgi:hypothetical protein